LFYLFAAIERAVRLDLFCGLGKNRMTDTIDDDKKQQQADEVD